jgi:hypothetical protein
MKHLNKFNESINKTEIVGDINKMFKFHSYYIWGIEFDLSSDLDDIIEMIDDQIHNEVRNKELKDIFNKYKGWKFSDEKHGYSRHDNDWTHFTIRITDQDGNYYIGRGETCPAESPQIDDIIDQNEEKKKDHEEYLKLKKKWGFK